MVYPGWERYTQGGRGVPGYTPPYVPPGYTTRVYTPVYHPGYTIPPTVHGLVYTAYTRPSGCPETKPWAQGKRFPWAEASQDLKTLRCVREIMPFCAELLRLPV